LVNNIVQLLNCSGATASDTQKALQGSEVILKYSGMTTADAQKIVTGLKTIMAQSQ